MTLERQNSTSKAVLMGDLMSLLSSLLFRRAKNQVGTYLTELTFYFSMKKKWEKLGYYPSFIKIKYKGTLVAVCLYWKCFNLIVFIGQIYTLKLILYSYKDKFLPTLPKWDRLLWKVVSPPWRGGICRETTQLIVWAFHNHSQTPPPSLS